MYRRALFGQFFSPTRHLMFPPCQNPCLLCGRARVWPRWEASPRIWSMGSAKRLRWRSNTWRRIFRISGFQPGHHNPLSESL